MNKVSAFRLNRVEQRCGAFPGKGFSLLNVLDGLYRFATRTQPKLNYTDTSTMQTVRVSQLSFRGKGVDLLCLTCFLAVS